MPISQVLSDLFHGDINFCCLCLKETTGKAVWIHDDIIIDSQDTQPMAELISSMFVEDVVSTASAFGMFCNKCKTSIVNNYKFQKMCKENLSNLTSLVNSISESFENVIPDLEGYKTLFVSIDLKDFISKQFYDNVHYESTLVAYQRLYSTVHAKVKPKLSKQEESHTTKDILKETLKIDRKRHVRQERTSREPTIYDIPSVPTSHMTTDNNTSSSFICKICLLKFVEENKLRCHFFKKHFRKDFKCSKCPRNFITNEMLKEHEDDFHGSGVCSECGKHFTNKYVQRKHELNHSLQITCDECGRVYRSVEAYKKHITDDVCRQKSKKTAEQAVFQCDHCKKRYCYKPYLAKHIMHEHGNAVGFRCKFCNKQFYTQSRLKTHLVKHTREKNFVCSLCGGRFVTRESLIYHTRLHTGEKPYQCDHCDKAFLSASRRLDHVRRHHMAPSLECDICHVKFKATGSLLKHRKRHFNPRSKLSTNRNMNTYGTIITSVVNEN